MAKLINNHSKFRFFIVLLTLSAFVNCTSHKQSVSKIKGKQIPVTENLLSSADYEEFIAPYRNHIDRDLDNILSYAPENMDKSKGKWQTTIGNFLADITLEKADKLFYEKYKKNVDICLLNHGGIRAPITQGNVTARTAYQIMPFENSLIIVELKGEQITEMADYFIQGKKAHPISGIQIELTEDEKSYKSIKIQGNPLDSNKIYSVATSDYLVTGGDNMIFFEKALTTHDMNYKLRNLIIDYFKENDTIPIVLDNRITVGSR